MLPYVLIYPLWVVSAVAYPALMSLHAVSAKEEQEVWLGYWVLYAAGTVLYPFTDHILWAVVTTCTYLLGVDLYYEIQVCAIIALVNPKYRQLDKVHETNNFKNKSILIRLVD